MPLSGEPAAERDDPARAVLFSVVVPAYNEEEGIAEFHRRLAAVMDGLGDWEVIYVNDGSRDRTAPIVTRLRETDEHIALVNLSRNFGKEIATTAGLDHARGDAVIVIDADLQDPPELIVELVAATTWSMRNVRSARGKPG